MSDLSQYFSAANESAEGFVDTTREQQLEAMGLQQPELPDPKPQEAAPSAAPEQEEEEGGNLLSTITQGIDGVLGTNLNETLEQNREAAQPQKEAIAKGADEFRKNQPEVVKTAVGAGLGAAEAIGSAAEVVGDTVKTVTGLAEETDDVFSNKYEWAKWDLGKDEYGAQTGVGKIAQGFAEFGILMAATGGFGGATAGASVLTAGLRGAASGVAADMISAMKGEGNLSNLIRDNAPEWYPTWLTALAVDDDDNPWEAALKTALEGGGIGFVADAAIAYATGARAARAADKAGKSLADQEKAAEAAFSAKHKALDLIREQRVEDSPLGQAARVNPALAETVANAKKGIPVTYDDVANAFPQYFEPGTRIPEPDFHPEVYNRLNRMGKNDGLSINPFTGEQPRSGKMVAIDGAVLENVTPETVANFIALNYDKLTREDVFLGSWVSQETGQPVVELSRLVADQDEALLLGRAFDQEGIFDIDLSASRMDGDGYISTGGSDRLRETKGGHITPATDLPLIKEVSEATSVVQAQRSAKASNAPVATGASITQAQLKKIANAVGDEPAKLLKQISDGNPVDISKLAKASRQTVDEVAQEAAVGIQEALGGGGQIDFTKILKQKVGDDVLLTRAGIVQVRGLMQEMSAKAAQTSISIKRAADGGKEFHQQFDEMVDNLKGLLAVHKESANAYSKYLSTYKIKVPILGEIDLPKVFQPETADNLAASLADAGKTLDELKAKVKSGDPKAKSEAVRLAAAMDLAGGDITKTLSFAKNARRLAGQDALSIMYNSMLSSPTTHIINGLSNLMQVTYRPLAAMAGGNAKTKKQAIAAYSAFFSNVQESWGLASKVFADGSNVNGSKGFVQSGEVDQAIKQLSIAAEASADLNQQAASGWMNTLHDMANFPLFNWPSKLLTTSDEFFKALVSRMEFQAKTMGDAIDAAGSSGKPVEDVYKELLEKTKQYNFGKETGEILNEDLLAVAKEVTFQTQLEGQAKAFGDFVNNVPVLRAFFPFVKTGHNIMVYTGTHVPLLSSRLKEVQAVMNGTDEYAKAVMKGRQAVGRYLIITGAVAAYSGMITGNGPPDPAERKAWLKNNRPRSIKVGDKFIDYSRIEPFGQIMSAVADLVEMSKYATKHGLGGDQIEYLAGYLTYAIAQNFTNKSYMQGVVPLGQLLTPGWQGLASLQTVPIQQLNNFIPLSGARRAFSNAMTPYMQEYTTQVDRIWDSMTMGLLPIGSPSHDWLDGSQIESPAGAINALNPLKTVTRKQSFVRDQLEDMEYDSSVISKTLRGVELKGEHKSRLQQLMGESGLEQRLERIMKGRNWMQAKDDYFEKVRQGKAGDKRNELYYKFVNDEITATRDRAIAQMTSEFPELMEQIHDHRVIRNSQRAQGSSSEQNFDDLANFYRQ